MKKTAERKPVIINECETNIQSLTDQRKAMHNLVNAIIISVRVIDDHPDPGSVDDCWRFLDEQVDDCYNAIEYLYKNAKSNNILPTKEYADQVDWNELIGIFHQIWHYGRQYGSNITDSNFNDMMELPFMKEFRNKLKTE